MVEISPAQSAMLGHPPKGQDRGASAFAGFMMGLDTIGECFALASLCFSGALAAGLGLGTTLFLLASGVAALIAARWSQFPNAIATAQDASIAVLATTMAAAASVPTPPEVRLAAALAVLALSTAASGALLWLIGHFRLARFARMLPFPVAAGFLAACGLLLVTSAFEMIFSESAGEGARARLALVVLPGLILAALLSFAIARSRNAHAFILILLGSVTLYWLVHASLGLSSDQAAALGMIHAPTEAGQGLALNLSAFAAIPPEALWLALPGMIAVVAINQISTVLNLAGVELELRREIDLNRELRLAGVSNLVCGGFAGPAAYLDGPTTIMAERIGLRSRALGLGYGAATLLGCLFASVLVQFVPLAVSFGLLVFYGASMMKDWLWTLRHQIALREWLVILGIMVMAAWFGLLFAILVGLFLALAGFAVEYAKSPVIRARWTGTSRRSTFDRAPALEAVLAERGRQIQGLGLQGYLYFGSIESVAAAVRALDWPQAGHRQLILDASAVTGIDGAACAALDKLFRSLSAQGVAVSLSGQSPEVMRRLESWNPDFAAETGITLYPDVDAALERAETQLLADLTEENRLDLAPFPPEALAPYFTPLTASPGEVLIATGDSGADVYLLRSGRLGVYLETESGLKRLRALGPGALVGELALYTGKPRSALVRVDAPSEIWVLTAERIAALEDQNPSAALLIHRMIAGAISDKLTRANAAISAN